MKIKLAALILFTFVPLSFGDNIKTVTPDYLIGILKEEGYATTKPEGIESAVVWKVIGVKTALIVDNGGKYVHFYALCMDNASVEKANKWNRENKYGCAYFDENKWLCLRVGLSLEGGVSKENIIDFLTNCRHCLQSLADECAE